MRNMKIGHKAQRKRPCNVSYDECLGHELIFVKGPRVTKDELEKRKEKKRRRTGTFKDE